MYRFPEPFCETSVQFVNSSPAVYRPSNGRIYNVHGPATHSCQVGSQLDLPDAGDFDGNFVTDGAVFSPASGRWLTNQGIYHWGEPGDIPFPGDYDGDHRDDMVLRQSTGTW